jgi:hypothetical protein
MRGPRDSDAAQAALVVVGFDTLDGDEAEAFIPEPVEVGKEARVRRRSGESSEIFMWVELAVRAGRRSEWRHWREWRGEDWEKNSTQHGTGRLRKNSNFDSSLGFSRFIPEGF